MSQGKLSWYALQVRAQFEKIVAINLSRKGFEAFLPTYKIRGGLNEHRRCEKPLFPGCVFGLIQAAEVRSLLMTPGVMHIVGTEAGVKPVDQDEMAALKLIVQVGPHYQPCQFRETGRRVRVAEGALRNLEGISAESRNGIGIVIGISLLQRAVFVEIGEAIQVVPVSNTRTNTASHLLPPLKRTNWKNAPEQNVERTIGTSPHRSSELERTIRCIPATIVFDSFRQTSLAGARGIPVPSRSLVLQTEDFDIHLQICREREHRQILGQILSRRRENFANARFHLLRNGEKLQAATADTVGEFNFTDVPEGGLNLLVDLPHQTIIGELNG